MPRDVCAQNTVVDVPSRVLRVKVKDTAGGLSPRQRADLFRDNPALLFFCGLGALVPVSVADGKTENIVSVVDGKTGNIVSVADGKTVNIVSVADGKTVNIVSVADGKTGNIVSVADGKTGNISVCR